MGLALPLPRHIRRRPLAWAGRNLLRILLAAILSAGVTAAASGAVFVTTAPALVSLLVEPVSLLLIPGLLVAMILANATKPFHHAGGKEPTHDFTPQAVVAGALLFYFAFFLVALASYARRRRRRLTSDAASR